MTESNLLIHANRELDLIGWPKPTRAEQRSGDAPTIKSDEDWNKAIRKGVIDIVEIFAKQGHSGTSAAQTIGLVHQLLQYKPLSPLTNNPEEWTHISNDIAGRPDLWQNKRNSAAFSHDGGKTFYLLEKYTKAYPLLKRLPRKLRSWVWKKRRNWVNQIFTATVAK